MVTANGVQFPRLRYAYRIFTTPYVASVSPSRGTGGQIVTISGSGFSLRPANMRVLIANSSCSVLRTSKRSLICKLENKPAGVYNVILHVKGKGMAAYPTNNAVTFEYQLSLYSISPNVSGFGGGRVVSVKGQGFSSSTEVKICGNPCVTISSALSEIYCELPIYTGQTGSPSVPCSVAVEQGSRLYNYGAKFFTYQESLSSRITSVSPSRGGTGGGYEITITGTGKSKLGTA